jgi:large subunit ribosomal protein L10
MRTEKEFLVKEVGGYLDNSSYALMVEYTRLTVADVAALRGKLRPLGASFHVIKSTILSKAAAERNLPALDEVLGGQIAIISGGDDIASIVKTTEAFFKDKDKGSMKGALLSGSVVPAKRIAELRELPTMDQARARFLSLLNTPATTLVRLIGTPSQQLVNVLDAFTKKDVA